MPNYIQPTLQLTSNASTAGTLPGPFSWALALNISDLLTVDLVEQKTIETSTTLNANTGGTAGPIDGSALATLSGADADGNDNVTAGTVGGYLYLKNNSTTTNENIFIGIVSSSVNSGDFQAPTAPAAGGSGGTTTCLDNDTHDTLRTMTLKPGEFAFFPWDYVGDINWQAQTGTPQLEYWRFDRA
mgnify:CR=1 FL=1